MNEIAFVLKGQDNESYLAASCEERLYEVPDGVFCSKCVWEKDWKYLRPDFDLKIHKFDISFTYDGSCIVSPRLREIMIPNGVEEAAFHQLSKEKNLPTCPFA